MNCEDCGTPLPAGALPLVCRACGWKTPIPQIREFRLHDALVLEGHPVEVVWVVEEADAVEIQGQPVALSGRRVFALTGGGVELRAESRYGSLTQRCEAVIVAQPRISVTLPAPPGMPAVPAMAPHPDWRIHVVSPVVAVNLAVHLAPLPAADLAGELRIPRLPTPPLRRAAAVHHAPSLFRRCLDAVRSAMPSSKGAPE